VVPPREDVVTADDVEEVVGLDGREIVIVRPRDSEALLDEGAFEHDEFLPYWAELWPSAVELARTVGARALHGARVVELGCGLGLPSIAAALAGGRVTATDWAPDAVAFAARNAALNEVEVQTAVVSWSAPAALVEGAPWDLVLGSDLLYERRNVPLLLDLLPRLVRARGEAWIADPGRPAAPAFFEAAAERFTIRSTGRVHRLRPR
jgi:predicted nicotinamide N-methyase